ncbi:TonB-dependent receptor [Robiginitalea sp. SC105]|uniref:TonB-dependent receptor n=1 Tax=Robiginitalea sp. SC105 TaxID=2762332 RepID=UPI0016395853|nr:TonB-dependent receptor [Robiginitalea sp. SC105]MBC2840441.1 carboxypeptidase-like regulatory domain-containing protein [Robiginitalea sp. SC105]
MGLVRGQEAADSTRIDFAFTGLTRTGALSELGRQQQLRIYYAPEWFPEASISRSFRGRTLESIMTDLLSGTELNFYRYDAHTFILTRNTRIYDELPEQFFGSDFERDSATSAGATARAPAPMPIFIAQEEIPEETTVETVRIGRQTASTPGQLFILEGYIRERTSGNPVPDVAVLVTNRGRGTATDVNGYYRLELPPGLQELRTRFIGMEPVRKQVILYNDGQLDLLVDEAVEQLEEVVVEADADRNVEEVTAGTDRIDAEESKDIPLVLGERNILEVAASLPGISKAGEGATGLNVRGGRTDQNQFLLNSALVYNPTHFFGIFQALNPFVTESVDIYKGAIPVEFGGRLSAVFDIHTVDGDTTELKGEGSVGPVTANLAFEVPVVKGRSSLVLGGRGAYSDWILRSVGEDRLSGTEASFYDFIATYTDRINENNQVKATGYYSKDRFSITRDSLVGYSNRAASVVWNHTFDQRNLATFTLANSRYAFNIGYDGEANTDFDLGYSVEETELRAWNRFRYNDRHQFTYGLAAKYYSVNPGTRSPSGADSDVQRTEIPGEQALEAGIFLADRFAVSDRLELEAGIRWSFFGALGPSDQREYPEGQPRNPGTATDTLSFGGGEFIKTYGGPEIRASARYLLGPELSLRAGYSNMYQYIHTLTNTTTVSPIDTWKLSDYNIRPQKSRQVSLGIFRNFDDAAIEVSAEGYYKWSEDVLDFKTGARLLLNEAVETEVVQGDGRAYGIEFLIRKNRGRLNGWLGYTYSRTEVRFDSPYPSEQINNGEFFPANYDRPHDISLVANYRFTRRYSLSMNFAYQTGRPVTYPIGQYFFNNSEYVLYSDRNKNRIPDYIRLDLGINIEGNHRKEKLTHSFWTISVYNVLGRSNPYSVYFVSEGGEVRALQSSIFAIPIPSITYNFKF